MSDTNNILNTIEESEYALAEFGRPFGSIKLGNKRFDKHVDSIIENYRGIRSICKSIYEIAQK